MLHSRSIPLFRETQGKSLLDVKAACGRQTHSPVAFRSLLEAGTLTLIRGIAWNTQEERPHCYDLGDAILQVPAGAIKVKFHHNKSQDCYFAYPSDRHGKPEEHSSFRVETGRMVRTPDDIAEMVKLVFNFFDKKSYSLETYEIKESPWNEKIGFEINRVKVAPVLDFGKNLEVVRVCETLPFIRNIALVLDHRASAKVVEDEKEPPNNRHFGVYTSERQCPDDNPESYFSIEAEASDIISQETSVAVTPDEIKANIGGKLNQTKADESYVLTARGPPAGVDQAFDNGRPAWQSIVDYVNHGIPGEGKSRGFFFLTRPSKLTRRPSLLKRGLLWMASKT